MEQFTEYFSHFVTLVLIRFNNAYHEAINEITINWICYVDI